MLEIGLVFWRSVHFAALLAFFGIALFPLYALERTASTSRADAIPAAALLSPTAGIVTVSGIILFGYVAAGMVGSWSELDWDGFASVAFDTTYGRIWIAHILLTAVVTAMTLSPRLMSSRSAPSVLASLGGLLLGSLALVGHAQDGQGAMRVLHIGADALHLLAAGAWFGGITALFAVLRTAARGGSTDDVETATSASAQFAGLGTAAVAALIASGLINTWILVGTPQALFGTSYGRLLLLKLALFGAMLLLAAGNRFWLVPRLLALARAGGVDVLVRLQRHVSAEQVLGFLVVAIVAAMGTMEPAASSMTTQRTSARDGAPASAISVAPSPVDLPSGRLRPIATSTR